MATRRAIDGLYRTYEPNPEAVNEVAVKLLTRLTQDPHMLDRLIGEYDVFRDTWLEDDVDVRDAVYEACGRAAIIIPTADV